MAANRRSFLKKLTALGSLSLLDLRAQGNNAPVPGKSDDPEPYGNVIEAPVDPEEWPEFRDRLTQWRTDSWKKYKYDGRTYEDAQFKWSQSNYSCCFLMMYDLEFYDPVRSTYTVDKIIERGIREFGGYDSLVLWHAYPRIGVDDRNQFDHYRDMPGGLPGVRDVTRQFQEAGIKVFINYNPWDTGTRRERKSDIDALIEIIAAINADGIFLDTMKEGGADFRAKLDSICPGIILEGELPAQLGILPTHHQSWAQWFGDRFVPGILRNKWYERRHIQHNIARWNRDHTTELQQAWMNGSGIMIWENVFGQYMAWCERDKSILRSMLPIQRRYSDIFNGEGWTPLVFTKTHGVFASMWEGRGIRIWTLINRLEESVHGDLLEVQHQADCLYFNLITGSKQHAKGDGTVVLRGTILPRGVGCFISGSLDNLGGDFQAFRSKMKRLFAGYRHSTGYRQMSPVRKPVSSVRKNPPETYKNMVEILPASILLRNEMQGRECGTYYSYPLDNSLRPGPAVIYFEKDIHIAHIAVDRTPVTNAEYAEFLTASGYRPTDSTNFLKHWTNGDYPEGKRDHPVVYVALDDARAYAAWAGKRLLSEEEWLFTAQGYGKLRYPWGSELRQNCYNTGNDTSPVDAHPEGVSPFGCLDMCGNTWELTETEYADKHNRFCIIKGGSYFNAKGSHWYVKGGPQPSAVSTKLLLLYPGMDRSPTIGFRCAIDLQRNPL